MFLNVWCASLRKCAWKWLIFIASVISGCIFSIVWTRSSKSSKSSFFPSKINVSVDTRLSIVAACGRCWVAILAFASTRRLMEFFASELWFLGVCSTIGKLLSGDTCVDRFWCWCDGGLRGVKIRPERNSGIWFVWAVCPVTMWWVCGCRSGCVSGTDNSLTSSGILCRVSSITFDTCRILMFPDAFSKKLNPYMFPAFWVRSHTTHIPSRRCIYWPDC